MKTNLQNDKHKIKSAGALPEGDPILKRNTQRGITLVALIITVIVLLILAMVSIRLVMNGGIIDRAERGTQTYTAEEVQEQIKLAVAAAKIKGNGFLTSENLNTELDAMFNDGITVDKDGNNFKYKGYKIKLNGEITPDNIKSILPDEYQQIEYIESSGTQYIDTKIPIDFVSNLQTNFNLKFAITNLNTVYILGGSNADFKQIVCFGNRIRYDWINQNFTTYFPTEIKKDKIYQIYQENGKLVFESNSLDITTTSESKIHFGLFGKLNVDGSAEANTIANMRLYEFTVERNNSVVYNFIPCYTTTTVTDVDGISRLRDTIGLYDTVNGQFYVNKGTGTFGYELEDGTYVAPQNN